MEQEKIRNVSSRCCGIGKKGGVTVFGASEKSSINNPRPFGLVAGDIIVIVLFILLGLSGLWFNITSGEAGGRQYVRVFVDNRLEREYSINSDTTDKYSFFFGADGEHRAYLEVQEGRVRMMPLREELCPRGICSHTGWISGPGESIVCLPNRILIVVEPVGRKQDDDEVDLITY